MKIAVCLSGQPRTVKYCIKSLFEYYGNVDYFCHAWNYNDHKYKNDGEPLGWLKEPANLDEFNDAISILRPKALTIEGVDALGANRFPPWDSMLYSAMMANHLKSLYETACSFKYDLVVKTRYDVAYPKDNFNPNDRINHIHSYNPQFDLFTQHAEHMPTEYEYLNISDVTFYGSSWAMDVATDLYWYVKRKYSARRLDDSMSMGPGTLMAEYISTNNLRFCIDHNIQEIIYRLDAIPLDPQTDFEDIMHRHYKIYR